MKIAIGIFAYFPWGGLQYDMLNIARELCRRGADVTIYTGSWQEEELPRDIRVEIIETAGLSNHARAVDFACKFHQAASEADIKFAFNRFGGCDFYFAADDCFAAALEKKRGAFFCRHLGRYRVFSRLEREIFSSDSRTHIFYIAPAQKADFQRIYGTDSERFTFLGPGIKTQFVLPDSCRRQACRELLGAAPEETVCLFAAANWRLKGGDRVMTAFARLPEELRFSMRLHFAGGDDKGHAQRLARRLGILDRCVFHGKRQDMENFFQAADILLHPARKEAAGNVIAESLACGVPVILTDICGYASLVEEHSAGIVLHGAFSSAALEEAVRKWHAQKSAFKAQALAAASAIDFHGRARTAADKILASRVCMPPGENAFVRQSREHSPVSNPVCAAQNQNTQPI
ncbi:MAG: glycosyltransferase family 4 protein [Lentisphaeria bacterium]|nr:glycosyltransferase family 4 protein [Lentisphaeria bacterium]